MRIFLEKKAVKSPQRPGAPPPKPRWPLAAVDVTSTYWYTFIEVRF